LHSNGRCNNGARLNEATSQGIPAPASAKVKEQVACVLSQYQSLADTGDFVAVYEEMTTEKQDLSCPSQSDVEKAKRRKERAVLNVRLSSGDDLWSGSAFEDAWQDGSSWSWEHQNDMPMYSAIFQGDECAFMRDNGSVGTVPFGGGWKSGAAPIGYMVVELNHGPSPRFVVHSGQKLHGESSSELLALLFGAIKQGL